MNTNISFSLALLYLILSVFLLLIPLWQFQHYKLSIQNLSAGSKKFPRDYLAKDPPQKLSQRSGVDHIKQVHGAAYPGSSALTGLNCINCLPALFIHLKP